MRIVKGKKKILPQAYRLACSPQVGLVVLVVISECSSHPAALWDTVKKKSSHGVCTSSPLPFCCFTKAHKPHALYKKSENARFWSAAHEITYLTICCPYPVLYKPTDVQIHKMLVMLWSSWCYKLMKSTWRSALVDSRPSLTQQKTRFGSQSFKH